MEAFWTSSSQNQSAIARGSILRNLVAPPQTVQSDAKEIAAEVVRGLRDSGFELQGKSPMD